MVNINIVLITCQAVFLALPYTEALNPHNASIIKITELRRRELTNSEATELVSAGPRPPAPDSVSLLPH